MNAIALINAFIAVNDLLVEVLKTSDVGTPLYAIHCVGVQADILSARGHQLGVAHNMDVIVPRADTMSKKRATLRRLPLSGRAAP